MTRRRREAARPGAASGIALPLAACLAAASLLGCTREDVSSGETGAEAEHLGVPASAAAATPRPDGQALLERTGAGGEAPDTSSGGDTDEPAAGAKIDRERLFRRITAEQERDILDRAFPLLVAKWPFDKVFVCWEELDERHGEARSLVREAVGETWEAVSGLEFLGWERCTEGADGIRIAVRDEGPHVKHLGRFVSGVPEGMVLNFDYARWGTGCRSRLAYCNRVIAVHEFGHAIGFAHEQNRPDTPGECDRTKRGGHDGDTLSLTPWDPESVMNYCNPIYGNDGVLSAFDIVAVQYIYGDS